MARYKMQGTFVDQVGNVVPSGTVAVFLTGTSTAASIYTTSTSTTAVNSVTSNSTTGRFSFFVDNLDYDFEQGFDVVLSKATTSGLSYTSQTYANVSMSGMDVVTGTYTISTARTISTHVIVPKGVIYTKSASGTMAFTGKCEIGFYAVFSGFAAGDVTFAAGSVQRVLPEWWGTTQTDLQSALDGVPAAGEVYVSSAYTITSALTITKGLVLRGTPYFASITSSSATADMVQVNTTARVEFHHLLFQHTGTPTAGAAIRFTGAGGVQVNRPRVFNCTFSNNWDSIVVAAANQFQIQNCDFLNAQHDEIILSDADSSDSEIIGCFCNTGVGIANAAISVQGAPGLRIIGNKLLGYIYGVEISLSANCAPITILGNSIENQATTGILIQQAVAAKTLGTCIIASNNLASQPTGIHLSTGGTWAEQIVIASNAFNSTTTHINLDGGTKISVVGNHFLGGTNGIVATANCANLHQSANSFSGVTTELDVANANPLIVDTLTLRTQTSVPASAIAANYTIQVGSASLTFGAAAEQNKTITFPVAFSAAPRVVVSQTSGAAAVTIATARSIAAANFVLYGSERDAAPFTGTETYDWIAIGPK